MTNTCLQLKRQKLHHRPEVEHHHDMAENHHSLLPGLPDHIAQLCLARVPPSTLFSVCRTWRRLLYSPSFPPFLNVYALLVRSDEPNSVHFAAYDPISVGWRHLPPPPPQLRFLLRHPSFISRRLPVQSVAVSDTLVVVAGTDDRFMPALSSPLVFNPSSGRWSWGPNMSSPRRWCSVGSLGGAVYVASGVGSHYSTEVARSVETWHVGRWLQGEVEEGRAGGAWDHVPEEVEISSDDRERDKAKTTTATTPRRRRRSSSLGWRWERRGNLKDGKFSRDAIEAVGWRRKLCMVNVEGDAAKEGTIYDTDKDTWTDMPEGMLTGWRGPATVLLADQEKGKDEEALYVVDESKGILKKYDDKKDCWSEVVESGKLKGARQMTVRGGKVCVLDGDGGGITVVDLMGCHNNDNNNNNKVIWDVKAPDGFQIMGIHILPRMINCMDS